MPKKLLRKTPEKKIKKIERRIESSIEQIIEDGRRNSWKNLPQRQIEFVRREIHETIKAYPKKLRPIVASIMTICYFSIVPGVGTMSLIVFGGI
jgi:GTP cyclohydrolase I